MTQLTIKYQIITVVLSQWTLFLRRMFSNNPYLLKRDTYPNAKLQKIIEKRAVCRRKNPIRRHLSSQMFSKYPLKHNYHGMLQRVSSSPNLFLRDMDFIRE